MPGYQLIGNKWKTLFNQLTLSFVIILSHYIVKAVYLVIFTFHIVCSKSDITVMLNSKIMKSSKSSFFSACSSSSERRSLYFGLVSCPCENKGEAQNQFIVPPGFYREKAIIKFLLTIITCQVVTSATSPALW